MFNFNCHILCKILFLISISLLFSCNQTARNNSTNDLASASLANAYTARGNEPFWMATIQEPNIIFRTPEREVIYPYVAPKEESNTIIFESATSNDTLTSSIQIRIMVSDCTDSMSGEAFPYTATVQKDDTTYTGCAFLSE